MQFFKALVGGLIGGAMGASIWGVAVHLTGYELGIIAWVTGVLVGVGILAAVPNARKSVGRGVLAAVLALVAILAGKGVTAYLATQQLAAETGIGGPVTEELLISFFADEVVVERENAGDTLVFPETADDYPDARTDYPAEVWDEAVERWIALSPDEQLQFRAEIEFGSEVAGGLLAVFVFIGSFGLFDLLWFVLAIGSAYRIGRSSEHGDEADAAAPSFGEAPPVSAGARIPGLPAETPVEQPQPQRVEAPPPDPRPETAPTSDEGAEQIHPFLRGDRDAA